MTRDRSPVEGSEHRSPAPPEVTTDPAAPDTALSSEATEHFPKVVVGVGASAGGLEALQALFSTMPSDSGAAFVVVQHLKEDAPSLLPELLSRGTEMPVVEATDGLMLERDHIYVIPPGHGAGLQHERVCLTPMSTTGMKPIDRFLRSLAREWQERAICVILSGTATDGTLGLKAVKEHGGLAIAQDPRSAQQDGMPRSAIQTGLVDAVLVPSEMATVVVRYVHHFQSASGQSDEAVQRILGQIRARTRHDFRQYKSGTLVRRIHRRMGMKGQASFAAYEALLRRDPDELDQLHKDLLIGVTRFFRDPEAFEALSEHVLKPLVAKQAAGSPVRVWVPACSTGEEAYSIAMALLEAGARDFKIFATDIDQHALDIARRGVYPPAIREEVSPERLARFFIATEDGYHIVDELREGIVFAEQNLVADPAFSRLDLVSCRNLMIYLEPALQQKVLALFHFALKPDGVLFLGTSETAASQEAFFTPVSKKWRIYRRVAGRSSADYPIGTWEPARLESGRADAGVPKAPPNLPTLVQTELLASFTPAAVVVNARLEVLYFHGPVGEYLSFPAGKSTLDVASMCPAAARHKLRRAIAASREARDLQAFESAWPGGRASTLVRITAKPLTGELTLVTFEPAPHARQAEPDVASGGTGRVEELEAELRLLQDELKSNADEMESSTEELKASNEEMMSMNEELQSTNEELETTKEELQSLNEELTTVNQQLNEKVLALEEANNDLINYLGSTDTATIFLDLQLHIKRFTPVTRKLLNVLPTDVGRPLIELARKVEDTTMLSDAALVIENLTPIEKEVQTPSHQWFLRRILPYRTQDHRIAGVVITFTDIMHLKQNEMLKSQETLRRHVIELEARAEQLDAANRRLTELERLKDDFLNAASHELRTPLSSVLGFAEFLEDQLAGPLTDQQAEFVGEIQRGAKRLTKLVDDLLDFARLEAGTFALDRRDSDLGALAKAVLNSLQPQARQGGLTLEARLPDAPLQAFVDPDRVEQVLLNLVGNAIKFTPEGGHVALRLSATKRGACFEVTDDGQGIAREALPHLFEKFYQADASITRAHGGTGLGLAISKAFIDAHGGHIWVESTPGVGSTFWIELPLSAPAAAPDSAPAGP